MPMVLLVVLSTSAVAAAALGGLAVLAFYPFLPRDLGGAPDLDEKARRVRIPVGTDDWIDGWHVAGTRAAVVLLLHGFARDHSRSWRYGAFLHRIGYHVVAIDFRSSRKQGRKPTTLGHFELEDADAALAWIRSDPSLKGYPIGVMGESLGGAVALMASARNADVTATVADCAFANGQMALEDSCERWARLPRWPSAPILRMMARAFTGCDPALVDVVSAAETLVDRPVLFIHGMKDNRLAPDQARRLWRAAGSKDPLWLMPEVGHNQGWIKHPALYEERIAAFFDHHLLGHGSGLVAGEL
jgi:pimeloyl-ACP methyl ester carboxylesterase